MITSSIDAADSFNPSDNFRESPRPEHHIHRESEPLPMGQSTAHGFDQPGDRSLLEGRRDVGTSFVLLSFSRLSIVLLGVTGNHRGAPEFQDQSFQRDQQDSFDSDRPLNVQPISQGGVAIDRDGDLPDLPEGQANKTDKIIGKVQKVYCCLVDGAFSDLTNFITNRSRASI